MLKVLIADDELPARDELRYLLSSIAEVTVVGEAENVAEVVGKAAMLKPDVIFLDINMRDQTGMEAAKLIREITSNAAIVFATAYEEYAVQAFEFGAVDYILKPFEQQRVCQTIKRILSEKLIDNNQQAATIEKTEKIHIHKLPVEKQGKIMLLDYSEILYVYAHTGNAVIVADHGEFIYNGTLADLESRFKGTHLCRVHKSYLVNMDRVCEVIPWFKGTYWLKMSNDKKTEIPVSKNLIKGIKQILGLK